MRSENVWFAARTNEFQEFSRLRCSRSNVTNISNEYSLDQVSVHPGFMYVNFFKRIVGLLFRWFACTKDKQVEVRWLKMTYQLCMISICVSCKDVHLGILLY